MLKLLFLIPMGWSNPVASPVPPADPVTAYEICVEACTAWAARPGYELRQCVSECQRTYFPTPGGGNPRECVSFETCVLQDVEP